MMSRCVACGTLLQDFEYQSRAADEAHTISTSCPRCPVNPSKLDVDTMPRSSFRGMTKHIRRSLPITRRTGSHLTNSYIITIDIPYGHELYDIDLNSRYLVQQISLHKRSLSEQNNNTPDSIYYSVSGLHINQSSKLTGKIDIGMGVSLETYEIYNIDPPETNRLLVKANFEFYSKIKNFDCYIYSSYGTKTRQLVMQIGNVIPSSVTLEQIVNIVYGLGFLPKSALQYIPKSDILKLSNLSPRAWDASAPPTSSYTFTSKPDGQRMWMIWYGNIWYICEPKCKGGMLQWKWTSKHQCTTQPIVIDSEYMLTRGFIMIDFLTSSTGEIAPISRDIQWLQLQYSKLLDVCSDIHLQIREYFTDYDSAVTYCKEVSYPTDGVVAIRDGSTEILKVKPFKSMELAVTSDRLLVTADGNIVIQLPDTTSYDIGAIIEVRFTMKPDGKSIIVHDIFERPDKDMANDSNAVSNIIRSGLKLTTPDDNERRAALLWCNNIRRSITELAVTRPSNKSIVVDIGTGTGQGIDTMPRLDTTSYVFIEPDENKCKSLARRIGAKHIHKDPHKLISAVKGLKTRSLSNLIINCSLGDILNVEDVSNTLFSETKSIIAAFSAHFVVSDLHDIHIAYHIPIYACMYVYDDTNHDGVLVNTCGVNMYTIDDNNANVKWGNDKEYTEPITTKKDYVGLGNIIPGYELYDLPDETFSSSANTICKNVALIVP